MLNDMPQGVFKGSLKSAWKGLKLEITMWRVVLVISALATGIVVLGVADELISKGKWLLESIMECPDPELYAFSVDVKRKKLNRTHDGFWASLELKEEINDDFGINLELCIKVDGGCKLVQVLVDPCFCDFIMRFAEQNFASMLSMAGLLTHDCPIPTGIYEIDDYIFDYSELPEEGMLGQFQATTYLTRDGENIGCIMSDLTFTKDEEDE